MNNVRSDSTYLYYCFTNSSAYLTAMRLYYNNPSSHGLIYTKQSVQFLKKMGGTLFEKIDSHMNLQLCPPDMSPKQ